MMILRLLNPQGIAGLAAAVILGLLLIGAKIDARHWKKQSAQFEQLYRGEAKAHAGTVANYLVAAEKARAADKANVERVRAEQSEINQESDNALKSRTADARARYDSLRRQAEARSNPGGGGSAAMPELPAPASQPSQAAGEDGLPSEDGLIATEQAIQLDELIKWVRRQAGVDVNGVRE